MVEYIPSINVIGINRKVCKEILFTCDIILYPL